MAKAGFLQPATILSWRSSLCKIGGGVFALGLLLRGESAAANSAAAGLETMREFGRCLSLDPLEFEALIDG